MEWLHQYSVETAHRWVKGNLPVCCMKHEPECNLFTHVRILVHQVPPQLFQRRGTAPAGLAPCVVSRLMRWRLLQGPSCRLHLHIVEIWRLKKCSLLSPHILLYFIRSVNLHCLLLTWFGIRKHDMQACNTFLSGMSEYRQNVSNPILGAFAHYKVPLQSALGFTESRLNYESASAFIDTAPLVSPIFPVAQPCETNKSLCAIHWSNWQGCFLSDIVSTKRQLEPHKRPVLVAFQSYCPNPPGKVLGVTGEQIILISGNLVAGSEVSPSPLHCFTGMQIHTKCLAEWLMLKHMSLHHFHNSRNCDAV